MLLAAFLLTGLAQGAAAPAPAQITPACASAFRSQLPAVSQAIGRQAFDAARTQLDAIAQGPCKDDPAAAQVLPAYAADLSLRQMKFVQAVKEATSAQMSPQHPLWPFKQLTLIAAHNGLGDKDAANRQLVTLLTAHNRTLAARMKPVERFETDTALVQSFEGELDQGIFKRRLVFVAAPKAGGMPQTLMLTINTEADKLRPQDPDRPWFIDHYACHGRTTVEIIMAPRSAPGPDYETVKAKVIAALRRPPGGDGKAGPGLPACTLSQYVLPGFFNDGL
ncbi:hypothetical protein ABOZ73_11535 [Caulobacter sp. 73W]|uniref:Uncharacterized protein n=1 Tax=Caulobacter sp. 73W TaxID=3161137 RepID=A0AB39KNP2_9CAUL